MQVVPGHSYQLFENGKSDGVCLIKTITQLPVEFSEGSLTSEFLVGSVRLDSRCTALIELFLRRIVEVLMLRVVMVIRNAATVSASPGSAFWSCSSQYRLYSSMSAR